MSSSAFTPTQIEVTNNVPVNVPVVTAWENYTPSLVSSGGSNLATSAVSGKWRREGDSVKIQGVIAKGATGATGSNPVGITLPTGLTIDFTKAAENQAIEFKVGSIQTYGVVAASQYDEETQAFVRGTGGNFANNAIYITKPGTASTYNASDIVANSILYFQATIPVAEWSGSGTTTLATRAVEEYVSYDQATAIGFGGTPSGTIVRGINGALLPNITTTSTAVGGTTFFLTTQSPILDTDRIVLEVTQDGVESNWIDVNNTSSLVPMRLSTADYGISINRVANSSSEIQVIFGNAGLATGGLPSTFGGVAASWSSQRTAIRWRVRVVKAGAEIGYPVSARNIVGDTSGSVVPTGMLGEVLTFTARGGLVTTGGWRIPDTNPLVTLTSGNWIIYGRLLNTVGIAAGTTSMTGAISNSSVAGTGVGVPAVYGRLDNAFVAAGSGLEAPLSVNYVTVSPGSTLPLYAQFISSGANNTINISGYAVRIA